jgi:HEAT repeat protein
VRVFQSLALSTFGDDEDAQFLVDTLRDVSDPNLQAQAAVALGFHGSAKALELVREAALDESLSALGRAGVIDALGLLLDRRPGLVMPATYRNSNVGALPVWAVPAFRTSY